MDDTATNPIFDPASDAIQKGIVQASGVLDQECSIEFIDETQEEFDKRKPEINKKWQELRAKFPLEEELRRNRIYKEAEEILLEIPKLIKYCDVLWYTPQYELDALWERINHALRKV